MTHAGVAAPAGVAQTPRTSRARVVVLGLAVVTAWTLVRSGPGFMPGLREVEPGALLWPHSPVTSATAYTLRLPLGPLLYQRLPEHGVDVYVLMHAAALVLTACLLTAWLLLRHGSQTGSVAVAVLLLSPLTAVLVEWLGIYDAFSVLTWALLIVTLPQHRGLQVPAAALAGLQNFEQVVVGLVLLALLPELTRTVGWRPWFPGLLTGAFLGRVGLEVYLRSQGVPGGSRLTFILNDLDHFGDMFLSFWLNLPLAVAGALGGLWVFAVPVLRQRCPGAADRFRLRVLVVTSILLAVGAVGADHTRVMVLSAVPLFVAAAVLIGQQQPTFGAFWRRDQAWLLALFPPIVLFGDIVLPLGVPFDPARWLVL